MTRAARGAPIPKKIRISQRYLPILFPSRGTGVYMRALPGFRHRSAFATRPASFLCHFELPVTIVSPADPEPRGTSDPRPQAFFTYRFGPGRQAHDTPHKALERSALPERPDFFWE